MSALALCTQTLVRASSSVKAISSVPFTALCAYAGFTALSWCVYDLIADRSWSCVMTLSGLAHCLGLALLCIQVVSTRSAAGVSARALILDGIAVSLRLSSTLFFDGYLPIDKSGDHVYQCADICSLLIIVFLLRSVLVTRRCTYQEAEDDICIGPIILAVLVFGSFLHGDMDANPIFDSLWMAGLLLSVVAVLPQYWLIMKSGGEVQAFTAHYIAASAVDRVLSGYFMWHVRQFITCVPLVGNFQHSICAILLAHMIHLLLLSDFAYFYVRALLRQTAGQPVSLVPEGYMV